MKVTSVNPAHFKFQYLPDYARYLLENKLDEFGLVGIRFARELNLPMMRPLSKLSEEELLDLSKQGNREILEALADNNVLPLTERNIDRFVRNEIQDLQGRRLMENSEVVAEDVILAFYLRRKLFTFFLHSFTTNAVLHVLIIGEVDAWSTEEQLLTTRAFLKTQAS